MNQPVHPTQAAARSNAFHIIFFILAFSGWLIALAGLAQVQQAYYLTGRDAVESLSLDWWTIFYEFFILLVIVLLYFERPVRLLGFRQALRDNVIIETVLLSFMAYKYCTAAYSDRNDNTAESRGEQATAAGVVILLVLQYIWIIVTGGGLVGPRSLPGAGIGGPLPTHSYGGGAPPVAQPIYAAPSPVPTPPKTIVEADKYNASPVGAPQVYVISDANPAANGGQYAPRV